MLLVSKKKHAKSLNDFDNHLKYTINSQVLIAAVSLLFLPMGILAAIGAFIIGFQNGAPISEQCSSLEFVEYCANPCDCITVQCELREFLPSYEQLIDIRDSANEMTEANGEVIFKELDGDIKLKM